MHRIMYVAEYIDGFFQGLCFQNKMTNIIYNIH